VGEWVGGDGCLGGAAAGEAGAECIGEVAGAASPGGAKVVEGAGEPGGRARPGERATLGASTCRRRVLRTDRPIFLGGIISRYRCGLGGFGWLR
jgi:hypothetical protein